MQRRQLGNSELQVSELGLGSLTWATEDEWPQVRALVREFVDMGGNLIDTSPAYANGGAEMMLGKLLRHDIDRGNLVLAGKAGFGMRDGTLTSDTSAKALLDDLTGSLQRLCTDHLDVWQIHTWGDAPIEESLAAVDHAVTSGMVRYAGVSNFVGWQTAAAATWQKALGRPPIVSAQVEYSLLARRAELEVVGCADEFGIGLIPWSPLGRGVLTGKYRTEIPKNSRGASKRFGWFVEPYLQPRSAAVVEAVATAAEGLGMSCAQVSAMWVRDAPTVAAILLGVHNPTQLAEYAALTGKQLPPEITAALDDVSGGPNPHRKQSQQ